VRCPLQTLQRCQATNNCDNEERIRDEQANSTNEQAERSINDAKQRGIGVVELLFAAATIGAAVLVGAITASKNPPMAGD